jgi:hypothetical protein
MAVIPTSNRDFVPHALLEVQESLVQVRYEDAYRPLGALVQAERVVPEDRIATCIRIEVDWGISAGIFRDKPSCSRVVVSGAVVVQASFRVEFATGVTEAVRQRARTGGQVPERIVRVRIREGTGRITQT